MDLLQYFTQAAVFLSKFFGFFGGLFYQYDIYTSIEPAPPSVVSLLFFRHISINNRR